MVENDSNPDNNIAGRLERLPYSRFHVKFALMLTSGEEIDGIFFEMPGYKLKITGGSSIDGFPMKPDLFIQGKKRILVTYGKGNRGKSGLRERVTFRGAIVGPDISQLNFIVTQYGPDPLEKPEETKE